MNSQANTITTNTGYTLAHMYSHACGRVTYVATHVHNHELPEEMRTAVTLDGVSFFDAGSNEPCIWAGKPVIKPRTLGQLQALVRAQENSTYIPENGICVRFYGLNELTAWVDADDLADAGSLDCWLVNYCGLTDAESFDVLNRDWCVVDDNGGLVAESCSYGNGWGSFDLKEYTKAREALESSGLSLEAFKAGLALGIDADDLGEAYLGEHDSPEDYIQELYEETGMMQEIPEAVRCYVDWKALARDSHYNGDFTWMDGHYFRNC